MYKNFTIYTIENMTHKSKELVLDRDVVHIN